jgi:hypothetical protein
LYLAARADKGRKPTTLSVALSAIVLGNWLGVTHGCICRGAAHASVCEIVLGARVNANNLGVCTHGHDDCEASTLASSATRRMLYGQRVNRIRAAASTRVIPFISSCDPRPSASVVRNPLLVRSRPCLP